MSKQPIVHHRWWKHWKDGAIVIQVTDCYQGGHHLAMSDDWSEVTCKNCHKSRKWRDPPRETFHVESG